MIDEIKKRLENREAVELECIDLSKFLTEELKCKTRYNKKCMAEFNSLVDKASNIGITMENGFFINEGELKYFKIKEPKPTFDDLIDVALQAGKDGVLIGVRVDFDDVRCLRVEYSSGEHVDQIFDYHDDYSEYVERIKSRYTETFVIESEEDISKVKSGAEIVLTNGCKGIVEATSSRTSNPFLRIPFDDCSMTLYLFSLKGATATQRKSKK